MIKSLDFLKMNLLFLNSKLIYRVGKVKVKVKSLSHVQLFVTPWPIAYQASPSMGFSRQEYWNGLPSPSPGDLPDPGIEPGSAALEADALTSEPPGKPKSYLRNSQSKGDTLIFLSVSCKQKINLS